MFRELNWFATEHDDKIQIDHHQKSYSDYVMQAQKIIIRSSNATRCKTNIFGYLPIFITK